jgi:predicted nucleic acid-binding protein
MALMLSLATKRLRRAMLDRGDQLFTSTITLGEILVKPLERGDVALSRKYEDALAQTTVLLPFDVKAARRFTQVRSERAVSAPDAIQLACAGEPSVDLFITNDHRLQGKQVDGIQFIVALDQVPI